MSQEDRKLMQIIDERIVNSTPEELVKLQQMDIDTQLDGVWFYDTCNHSNQMQQNRDIITKPFSK